MNMTERFLCFNLNSEEYGIPLLSVREVIGLPEFTPVPYTPNYFSGLMNLRGQVLSCIDLRTKLGMKPIKSEEEAVVICDINGTQLGITVDMVNSVLVADKQEISPKPEIESGKSSEYITGVFRKEKRLVLLLDITKLFGKDDVQLANKSKTIAA